MPSASFVSLASGSLLTPLALLTSLMLPPQQASASTIHVMNCNDSGAGSLRNAVASAIDRDTIDLSTLSCHRITLTRGAIDIPQDQLTLVGPGPDRLTIDGNHAGRVLHQTGDWLLTLRGLSIANGAYITAEEDRPEGGCIKSNGALDMDHVNVHHCLAKSRCTGPMSAGGGGAIDVVYRVRMHYSRVFASAAPTGEGGGIRTGRFEADHSRIYGNHGEEGGGVFSISTISFEGAALTFSSVHDNTALLGGGGLMVLGPLTLDSTAIFGNRTGQGQGGGVWVQGGSTGSSIRNSTLSENQAFAASAGFFGGPVSVANSTIAFNREHPSAGNACVGTLSGNQFTVNSTIVARNSCAAGPAYSFSSVATVSGANNLLQKALVPLPPDTISGNPRLAPLANNGGPTPTYALLSGSPAINRGANPYGLRYDQRGPGFPRMKGVAIDIGAVER